jgi:hypothetical protein
MIIGSGSSYHNFGGYSKSDHMKMAKIFDANLG